MKFLNKIKSYIDLLKMKIKTKSKIYDIFHCSNIILSWQNRIGKRCHIDHLKIGRYSYIGNNCDICNTLIGSFTSIGSNVKIVYGNHPTSKYISTHPLFYSSFQKFDIDNSDVEIFDEYSYTDKLNNFFVSIGNDVWIGDNVSILNGVTIGDGSIIAAGSVVNKDVLPYAIVGGVPAKLIRYRFDDETIKYLINSKWWEKSNSWIQKNITKFSDFKKFCNIE